FDDYLPAATAAGENSTEPISPATMGPLLIWALKFTEEFADDILARLADATRIGPTLLPRVGATSHAEAEDMAA
uniref:hypothetical protein n=1 Tax=Nocardia cyriacigeorgica TaxID=135487 RepID=UPI0024544C09